MEKKFVVITENGFMMEKKEKEISKKDTVLSQTNSNEETEKIIHGKFRRKV